MSRTGRSRLAVAALTVCGASQILAAKPLVLTVCDRVEVRVDDPTETRMGERLGAITCRQLGRLERLFGGRWTTVLRVRVVADMNAWHRRVGRAWYICAAVLHGEIVTQPARSLRKLKSVDNALAHEIAHLFIRRAAGRNCPRWLDEGLAQWLAGERSGSDPPENEAQLSALERRLGAPDSGRRRRRADYRAARALVARLVDRVGRDALLAALPELKRARDPLDLPVHKRSLRRWLFELAQPHREPVPLVDAEGEPCLNR